MDALFAALAASRIPSLVGDLERPDTPILRVNEALRELTGYAEAELLGRELSILLDRQGDPANVVLLHEAIANRAAAELELEHVRKDGTRFRGALYVTPVGRRGGEPSYLLCSVFDLTRRVAAAPPSAEATKFAELNDLARSVGHQFNNLLTIVRSNLEPLMLAPADARTRKRLERIASGIDRITELAQGFVATVRRPPAGAPAPPVQSRLPRARHGEVVLLVEPDETLRLQAGSMLRGLGYQIEALDAAEAALRRLSVTPSVHLLLVDAQARCEDGAIIAERVRSMSGDLPILQSSPSPAQRSGVVAKPFQLLALARAVREAIDGRNSA